MFSDVNWIAVVAAVVVHQVLGFLWYGALFGKMWLAATGKTPEEMAESGTNSAYIFSTLASLVIVTSTALVLAGVEARTLADGMGWGLLLGIGFIAMSVVVAAIFQETNRTVAGLYAGYQIVSLAIIGAILGAWQ